MDGLKELKNDYKNVKQTYADLVNLLTNGANNNQSTMRSSIGAMKGLIKDIKESNRDQLSQKILGKKNKAWISLLEKHLADLKAAREDFGTMLFRCVKYFGRERNRVKEMMSTCKKTYADLKKAKKEINSGKANGKTIDAEQKRGAFKGVREKCGRIQNLIHQDKRDEK